jgi:hypothetical protein
VDRDLVADDQPVGVGRAVLVHGVVEGDGGLLRRPFDQVEVPKAAHLAVDDLLGDPVGVHVSQAGGAVGVAVPAHVPHPEGVGRLTLALALGLPRLIELAHALRHLGGEGGRGGVVGGVVLGREMNLDLVVADLGVRVG